VRHRTTTLLNCSLIQLDCLVPHFLALLQRLYVPLLRNLPRRHYSLVLLHAVEIASEAKLLGRLATYMNKLVIEILELSTSRGEVIGDAFVEGMEGFDVALHVAEVCVRSGLVEL